MLLSINLKRLLKYIISAKIFVLFVSIIVVLEVVIIIKTNILQVGDDSFCKKNEGLKRGLQSVVSSDYPMIESGRSSSSKVSGWVSFKNSNNSSLSRAYFLSKYLWSRCT